MTNLHFQKRNGPIQTLNQSVGQRHHSSLQRAFLDWPQLLLCLCLNLSLQFFLTLLSLHTRTLCLHCVPKLASHFISLFILSKFRNYRSKTNESLKKELVKAYRAHIKNKFANWEHSDHKMEWGLGVYRYEAAYIVRRQWLLTLHGD